MAKLSDDATVSFAVNNDLAARVATATGLGVSAVRRKLQAANGNTLLRNLFRTHWPTRFTVARVERDGLHQQVSAATGLTVAEVRGALDGASGNAHVRSILSADDDDDFAAIGEVTVAVARDDGDLVRAIASVIGLSAAIVRRRLADANGRMLVRNWLANEWPDDDDDDGPSDAGHEAPGASDVHDAHDARGSQATPSATNEPPFHDNERRFLEDTGLAWPATDEQIRQAQREATAVAHPDRNKGNETANRMQRAINDGAARLQARLRR